MDFIDQAFSQAIHIIPLRLRESLHTVSPEFQKAAEEIRLRVGYPISILCTGREDFISTTKVSSNDLERLLELASCASAHSVMDQVSEGFLTIKGGHRVGICGTAVISGGCVTAIRSISSVAIRISRVHPGIADSVIEKLCENRTLCSTLILAQPGAGKTSLLRDLIQAVSSGRGMNPMRVGVADERGELAALLQGIPQFDLGPQTDVMDHCPKKEGLMMILRSMNPQVLAMDEITAPSDVGALLNAAGCGVILLATAHGNTRDDLKNRALYRTLLRENIFSRLVTIQNFSGIRSYHVEALT